jgi:cobalt-zinc-cadmium efflux system outer membrane protein
MLLLLLASLTRAETLSFDQVLDESLARGPAAQLARQQRRLSLAEAEVGAAFTNPAVSLEQIGAQTELRLTVPLPLSGQPLAARSAASSLREAARRRGDQEQALAVLQTGQIYLEAQRAQARAQLAEDTLALAARRRDAARALLAAQEIGEVDAAAAEAEAAQALSEASLARQDALRSRVALELELGRQPAGTLSPEGWPTLPEPEAPAPDQLPAVLISADLARAAAATRTRARMDLLPTPALTAGGQWTGPALAPVIGVEVPLPLFAPGLARAHAASAEADQAGIIAGWTAQQAQGAWLVAQAELQAAQEAYAATDAQRLRLALTELGEAWASGALALSDYVTRRDALVGGLHAAIDARYRLEVARLELWRLVGQTPGEDLP